MMSSTSLEAFLIFLKESPDRHRKNIIHNIKQFMPGCEVDYFSECSPVEFERWLREKSLNPAKEIGALLAIRGIIEFAVMDGITDSNQWKIQAKNVDALIKKLSSEPGKKSKVIWLQAHRETLEFKAAQSLKMKESWIELCELYLTNEALKKSLLSPEENFD